MIKAIAFDPGKTTGFAVGEILMEDEQATEIKNRISPGVMLVQTAQAVMEHADIMNFLLDQKPDYIICENFEFRQKARTGLVLISREYIGVVELYSQMNEECTLVMQQPGMVINGHFSNDKLKALGMYRKGNIHANEACMHLLHWAKFGSGFGICKGNFKLKANK